MFATLLSNDKLLLFVEFNFRSNFKRLELEVEESGLNVIAPMLVPVSFLEIVAFPLLLSICFEAVTLVSWLVLYGFVKLNFKITSTVELSEAVLFILPSI